MTNSNKDHDIERSSIKEFCSSTGRTKTDFGALFGESKQLVQHWEKHCYIVEWDKTAGKLRVIKPEKIMKECDFRG